MRQPAKKTRHFLTGLALSRIYPPLNEQMQSAVAAAPNRTSFSGWLASERKREIDGRTDGAAKQDDADEICEAHFIFHFAVGPTGPYILWPTSFVRLFVLNKRRGS